MRVWSKWLIAVTVCGLMVGSIGCAVQRRPEESRQEMRQRTAPITDRADRDNITRTRVGQNMRVADNVAEAVARLKTIDSATVMVTDRTAYVAVMFDKDYRGGMTNRVKEQVSRQVRKVDPSVRRVFVSSNPDFVDRMNDYARDVRRGRPVAGLWDGFMEMIRRTFPAAQ